MNSMEYFTDTQFQKYCRFIYEKFGISLSVEKKTFLQSKLYKLMARNSIGSYDEYYNILAQGVNRQILIEFTDEITINKTDFFREINHFDFIKNNMSFITEKNQRIIRNNEIRVWSSACSTGEEPYTIGMVLNEVLPKEITIKILATDINNSVLTTAQKGIYNQNIKNEVQPYYLQKYFKKSTDNFKIVDSIRNLVTFRRFNLIEPFPFKNTFDIIFCRNVMIYFDSSVQQQLLDKFYQVTTPGGLLFIGHSESLTGKMHRFQYVQPTVYIKS